MRYFTRDEQQVDGYYYDKASESYFYSPDGVGRYWYDTLTEMIEEHGDPVVLRRVTIDPEEF